MSRELRRYPAEHAAALARRNGSPIVFRDTDGIYWRIEPAAGAWQRFDGRTWARSAHLPDGVLEAPAGLGETADSPLLAQLGKRPPVADITAFVVRAVRDARILYNDGAVDAAQAAALATERMLVDRDARIWTTGFHSGGWYAWSNGSWQRSPAAPAEDSLIGESVLRDVNPADHAKLIERLASFRESGNYMPEPVAPPWAPPAPSAPGPAT